ncbi:MAG TPA: DUF6152 family protein [Gammaproteobacteria bacterium]|jgi:hypothetical protein
MKRLLGCLAVAGVFGVAGAALGHHASNLDYDENLVGTVDGVVFDIFWANPHIHIYMTVANDDGSSETWDMEGPNLNSLRRRGVTRGSIEIGDPIAVTGTLGRDGTRRIWAESIVKADGTVVMEAAQ